MEPSLLIHRPASIADCPAVAVSLREAAVDIPGRGMQRLKLTEARGALRGLGAPLLCHAAQVARRLGVPRFPALDLLELFAFVRPARFCLPTPQGLLSRLGLTAADDEDAALDLQEAAQILLAELPQQQPRALKRSARLAQVLQKAGWPWAPYILMALGPEHASVPAGGFGGFDVWQELPEWVDYAAPAPPDTQSVTPAEARERLAQLLGSAAELRESQADYAATTAQAFAPRAQIGMPESVLAEAGTGIGKTLGYIAPASIWAEKNGGSVWLSTYTKNLQRQLDRELDRLFPDPAEKNARVVIRKGRENYLCLLNLEDATQGGAARPQDMLPLALIARWAAATRDGDLAGGDFPAWAVDLHGRNRTLGLTDQRGECIHAGCPHYRKCFIERAVRKSRKAEMVIANHALVMIQAAQGIISGGEDDAQKPLRYIFDEGHHLFDAADSAFAAHLTGQEGVELRRWLRGPEGGRRSRARGLANRIGDLVADNEGGRNALEAILEAARALPSDGWMARLADGNPVGAGEAFLARVRQQILARAPQPDSPYGIECPTREPVAGLLDAAQAFAAGIERILEPINRLAKILGDLLADETAELETTTRTRIEGAMRSLLRRKLSLDAWRSMLLDLQTETPPAFVDWFALERIDGRDFDLGLYRHHLDPMQPFAAAVLKPAHGVAITSATLRDLAPAKADAAPDAAWQSAEIRTGARHLPLPTRRAAFPSPFDYAARTRVLVVTDVRRDAMDQVAAAYRELFLAAGGGGLGLFTAIFRLRAVQKRILKPLAAAGLPLYAQHVDPLDNATLVDIFRAEEQACLLGTDAMRDGVDVPGASLRLVVFDRVPWPRPDLLHKARRAAFGGQAYDDLLTRLKLKQAYGRLLRRAEDYGVFVVLDAQLPSRLLSAFPPDVEVRRIGVAEAVSETRNFLGTMRAQAARQSA